MGRVFVEWQEEEKDEEQDEEQHEEKDEEQHEETDTYSYYLYYIQRNIIYSNSNDE